MTLIKLNLTQYYGFLMTFPTIDSRGRLFPAIWPARGKKRRYLLEVRFPSQYGVKFSLTEDLHFSKTVMVS